MSDDLSATTLNISTYKLVKHKADKLNKHVLPDFSQIYSHLPFLFNIGFKDT